MAILNEQAKDPIEPQVSDVLTAFLQEDINVGRGNMVALVSIAISAKRMADAQELQANLLQRLCDVISRSR